MTIKDRSPGYQLGEGDILDICAHLHGWHTGSDESCYATWGPRPDGEAQDIASLRARLANWQPSAPSTAAYDDAVRALVLATLAERDAAPASTQPTATDREFAGQITRCALARHGLVPTADPGLPDVPLEEMLAAIRRVHNAPLERDADGTTIPVLCDPRLVAALYVLDAYEPQREPVVWRWARGGDDARGLFVVSDRDIEDLGGE